MLQNIKVDVIYYFTSTDFEMEFNLCGCCRMRLLTEKAEDRKEFVHMLSRAVSRSRVIICCGPLFGDSGLINGVAKAIGKSMVNADRDAFGIKDSAEIKIIDGSMPLVTSDGIFGGCIIESGPQAIIMLSESKAVRKNLLSTLIHPYIEELSVTPIKTDSDAPEEQTASSEAETVPPASIEAPAVCEQEPAQTAEGIAEEAESEEPTAATEETAETLQEQEEETTAEENENAESEAQTDEYINAQEPEDVEAEAVEDNDVISAAEVDEAESEKDDDTAAIEVKPAADTQCDILFEAENIPEPEPEHQTDDFNFDDIADGLYIEPQQVKFTKKHYYDVDYEAGADSYQYYAESDEVEYRPTFRLPILIITAVLLIAVLVLVYFLVFIPIRDGYTFGEYIREIFAVTKVGIRMP